MSLERVVDHLKDKFYPNDEEIKKVKATAEEFFSLLKQELPNEVVPHLTGSVAKETFIKGSYDMDAFLLFPESYSLEEMEETLFSILNKLGLSYEKRYASHPYARVGFKEYVIDVVPAYFYRGGKPKTAVDRTILHTKFVNDNLSKEEKKEVVVLKALLKAHLLYGAEIKVKGFSGYLCELLIYKFGSVRGVLEYFSNSKVPVVVEASEKNADFPLVLKDPVDAERNVASPVSEETLAWFILLSKAILLNPEKDFWFPGKPSFVPEHLYVVEFPKVEVVEDIKFGELWRLGRALSNHLSSEGFCVFPLMVYSEERDGILFHAFPDKLSEVFCKEGPSVYKPLKNLSSFLSKYFYEGVFLSGSVLYASAKRKCTELKDCVERFLKEYSLKHYRGESAVWKKLPKDMPREVEQFLWSREKILSTIRDFSRNK